MTLEAAWAQVLADPAFKFGYRGVLTDEARRYIIGLYERATGRMLLEPHQTA